MSRRNRTRNNIRRKERPQPNQSVLPSGAVPTISSPSIDLSTIVPDKKPINDAGASLKDISIAFSGHASENQINDIGMRNDELAVQARRFGTPIPPFQSFDNQVTNDQVNSGALPESEREDVPQVDPVALLQAEIDAMGLEIARKEQSRTDEYEDAGVFEDVQKLNDLKAQLRTAEDRQLEIPIEERQKLRGKGATKTEFDQSTRPKLEDAALEALASSRAAQGYSDIISTNMAIVDQKVDGQFAEKEFFLKTKTERLEKIEKMHSDILSADRAEQLEAKKHLYALQLEGVKADSALKKDLLLNLAESGISGPQLEGLANGSLNDILTFQAQQSSPTNWANMTYEQASQTLSDDDFKRYESYINYKDKLSTEQDSQLTEALSVQSSADSIITTLENLLTNENGLSGSVGTFLGNTTIPSYLAGGIIGGVAKQGDVNKFRAEFKKLISQQTLDTLANLKRTGATLGAISEKELQILQTAEQALGVKFDGDGNFTGRSNLTEKDFKSALGTMRMATMKTFIASSIGKAAYKNAGYQNVEDFDTIQKRYQELKNAPPVDYSSELNNSVDIGVTESLIRQEEGFRSEAYLDSTGTPTIGFGTTTINGRPVQLGDRLSQADAQQVMSEQIINNYTNFTNNITRDLSDQQFAALTSFEYNLGPGVWNDSDGQAILAAINNGDMYTAGQLMLAYNKSRENGILVENPVLVARRKREANLLLT